MSSKPTRCGETNQLPDKDLKYNSLSHAGEI
jgi:hypothetical protein